MAYFRYGWGNYVSVAEKRRRAEKKLAKLKKQGRPVAPVNIEGRTIAKSFWGQSWCSNLERYSDYETQLPRGRSYVRNGSVVDLQIAKGEVLAMVAGSELYKVKISIAPVAAKRWTAICGDCAGTIDSLVELLQGRLAKGVRDRVCREGDGLFPAPNEIKLSCSCPDWAGMCKHVAAALYGVGARLDEQPQLLFVLRGVDESELLTGAGQDLSLTTAAPASAQVLDDGDVAALFGLEMAEPAKADAAIAANPAKATATANGRKARVKAKSAPGSKQAAATKGNIPEAPTGKSGAKPPTPAAKPARPRSTAPSPAG